MFFTIAVVRVLRFPFPPRVRTYVLHHMPRRIFGRLVIRAWVCLPLFVLRFRAPCYPRGWLDIEIRSVASFACFLEFAVAPVAFLAGTFPRPAPLTWALQGHFCLTWIYLQYIAARWRCSAGLTPRPHQNIPVLSIPPARIPLRTLGLLLSCLFRFYCSAEVYSRLADAFPHVAHSLRRHWSPAMSRKYVALFLRLGCAFCAPLFPSYNITAKIGQLLS